MARPPFNRDDYSDSAYAVERGNPATGQPSPPAMEQDYPRCSIVGQAEYETLTACQNPDAARQGR